LPSLRKDRLPPWSIQIVEHLDTTAETATVEELDRLRDISGLCALLQHYVTLSKPDRQLWQDRLMTLDGVEDRELVRLHGELLALAWVEQNTGVTPILRIGEAPQCYRVTAAGVRALKEHVSVKEELTTESQRTQSGQKTKERSWMNADS
jgi:hypothetical protein